MNDVRIDHMGGLDFVGCRFCASGARRRGGRFHLAFIATERNVHVVLHGAGTQPIGSVTFRFGNIGIGCPHVTRSLGHALGCKAPEGPGTPVGCCGGDSRTTLGADVNADRNGVRKEWACWVVCEVGQDHPGARARDVELVDGKLCAFGIV